MSCPKFDFKGSKYRNYRKLSIFQGEFTEDLGFEIPLKKKSTEQ